MKEENSSRLIVTMTVEDLAKFFDERLRSGLVKHNLINEVSEKESQKLLPREKVAEIYNISLVTLNKWTKLGIIPKPIKRGKRVFYRELDIQNNINGK